MSTQTIVRFTEERFSRVTLGGFEDLVVKYAHDRSELYLTKEIYDENGALLTSHIVHANVELDFSDS